MVSKWPSRVFTALDRIAAGFPDDVEYVISLDTTKPITAGIREIVITLFQAVGLVILVVYIFLQNARSTLIPTLTVPVSLIGAFAGLPAAGLLHQYSVTAGPGAGHRYRGG